jgi:hypothetical protein
VATKQKFRIARIRRTLTWISITSSEEVDVVVLFRFKSAVLAGAVPRRGLWEIKREDGLASGAAASCRGGVVEARKGDSSAVRPGGI